MKRTVKTYIAHDTFQPSEEQLTILRYFDSLNMQGKKEALKRIEELTLISKYTKPPTSE